MSCLELYLTLDSSKIIRGAERTVGMSGYPSLSSVGNGLVPDGEKWSRCTNNSYVRAEKRYGTIVDVTRLYSTALDVMQSIFWLLVSKMKVAMKSLSKFWLFFPHFSDYFFTLSIYFSFFCTNLWENLFNTIIASFERLKILERVTISMAGHYVERT